MGVEGLGGTLSVWLGKKGGNKIFAGTPVLSVEGECTVVVVVVVVVVIFFRFAGGGNLSVEGWHRCSGGSLL